MQDFLGNTGELGAEQRPSFSLCEDDGWESNTRRCSQGALQVGLCWVFGAAGHVTYAPCDSVLGDLHKVQVSQHHHGDPVAAAVRRRRHL